MKKYFFLVLSLVFIFSLAVPSFAIAEVAALSGSTASMGLMGAAGVSISSSLAPSSEVWSSSGLSLDGSIPLRSSYDTNTNRVLYSADTAYSAASYWQSQFAGVNVWNPSSLNNNGHYDFGWFTGTGSGAPTITYSPSDGRPITVQGTTSAYTQAWNVWSTRIPIDESWIGTTLSMPWSSINTTYPYAQINNVTVMGNGSTSLGTISNGTTVTITALTVSSYDYIQLRALTTVYGGNRYVNNVGAQPLQRSVNLGDITASGGQFVGTDSYETTVTLDSSAQLTDFLSALEDDPTDKTVALTFYDPNGRNILAGLAPEEADEALRSAVLSGNVARVTREVIDVPFDDAVADSGIGDIASDVKTIKDYIRELLAMFPVWFENVKEAVVEAINNLNSRFDGSGFELPLGFIPSGGFGFSGIWHYVVEWVGSLAAGLGFFFGLWSQLPYAMVVPIYATAVIVIVVSLFKRYIH